jgi:hypothetical protein
MGADQIAAIRPALQELFRAVEKEDPDAENLCVTFTVPARENVWVQVMFGSVNASYPHATEPMEYLRNAGVAMPADLELDSWKAKTYATFTHGSWPVETLAEFIDRLFVALHALDGGSYEIDVAFETL